MGINVKIALVSHCISNILVTMVIFFLWKQNRKRFNGVANWMICFLMQAVGMSFILMRNVIPDFISIVVSNTFIVTGSVLLYFGFADFVEEKIVRWPYFVSVGVFFIIYSYYGVISPSLRMRLILLYSAIVVMNFQCVRVLWKKRNNRMEKNYRFTGGIIFLSGLFYLESLIENIYSQYSLDFFDKGMRFITLIIVSQIIKLVVTFSIMMMVNRKLLLSLEDESTSKEILMKELEHQAKVDILTNLWNRRTLEGRLKEEWLRSKRRSCKMSLILLDIDHFKKINDTFGHSIGDSVLKKISQLLRSNLRKTDFIGRWGGEEFIVICAETDETIVWKVAEKLRKSVKNHDFKLGLPVSISLGTATFDSEDSADEILKRADMNMYRAKGTGRNRTHPDICQEVYDGNRENSSEFQNLTV